MKVFIVFLMGYALGLFCYWASATPSPSIPIGKVCQTDPTNEFKIINVGHLGDDLTVYRIIDQKTGHSWILVYSGTISNSTVQLLPITHPYTRP